jgi:hypothetical protein
MVAETTRKKPEDADESTPPSAPTSTPERIPACDGMRRKSCVSQDRVSLSAGAPSVSAGGVTDGV